MILQNGAFARMVNSKDEVVMRVIGEVIDEHRQKTSKEPSFGESLKNEQPNSSSSAVQPSR